MDFRCFPCRASVEAVLVKLIETLRMVEPVKIRFFVGDPFFDRLPEWLDGGDHLDIEGWRRRTWELDDAFPQTVETEELLTEVNNEYSICSGRFTMPTSFMGAFVRR
jgi:hypothetical protein